MFRRKLSPRLFLMVAIDLFLVVLAHLAAYATRFEGHIPPVHWENFIEILPYLCLARLAAFFYFKLYRGMWRYLSLNDFLAIIKAVVLSSLVVVAILLLDNRFEGFSRSVFLLDAIYCILFMAGVRLAVRLAFSGKSSEILKIFSGDSRPKRLCVVLGAGSAGVELLQAVTSNPDRQIDLIGFFDDDPAKQGRLIHGVPVIGPVASLPEWRTTLEGAEVQEALIAMPSLPGKEMRKVLEICAQAALPHRSIPRMDDIASGRVSIKMLRDLDYRDLLGREPVQLDNTLVEAYLKDKVVLVTGAGGSIGSELCRQIVNFGPKCLILVDSCEANLYNLQMEMEHRLGVACHVPLLGTIQDRAWIKSVLRTYAPSVIFHAAAYKHVPMLESQPWQAVLNNVLGTAGLIESAIECGVERLVVVSTDKAVRPTSVMGASKRLTELIMKANSGRGTKLMAVRFGNVVGSAGSVLPLFRSQLARGGPLTVTHPEVVRYFMTVEEAALLILQAGSMGEQGEIFVLNMGEPVRIADMARDLITMSGLTPEVDIEIKFIGLRPGEKLYEELIIDEEGILPTGHEKIMVLRGPGPDPDALGLALGHLRQAALDRDGSAIKILFKETIPEYMPWNDQ